MFGRGGNAVEPHAAGGIFDGIDEIIDPVGQQHDVLAVDWGHKGLAERVGHGVRNRIGPVFDLADLGDLAFNIAVILEHVLEGNGDFVGDVGGLAEVLEEFLVLGQESGQHDESMTFSGPPEHGWSGWANQVGIVLRPGD